MQMPWRQPHIDRWIWLQVTQLVLVTWFMHEWHEREVANMGGMGVGNQGSEVVYGVRNRPWIRIRGLEQMHQVMG